MDTAVIHDSPASGVWSQSLWYTSITVNLLQILGHHQTHWIRNLGGGAQECEFGARWRGWKLRTTVIVFRDRSSQWKSWITPLPALWLGQISHTLQSLYLGLLRETNGIIHVSLLKQLKSKQTNTSKQIPVYERERQTDKRQTPEKPLQSLQERKAIICLLLHISQPPLELVWGLVTGN